MRTVSGPGARGDPSGLSVGRPVKRPRRCRSGAVQHGGRSRTLGRRRRGEPAACRTPRPGQRRYRSRKGSEASLAPRRPFTCRATLAASAPPRKPAPRFRRARDPCDGRGSYRAQGAKHAGKRNPKTGRGRSRGSAAAHAAGVWTRPACPRCNPDPGTGAPSTPRCGRAVGAGVLSARGGARRDSAHRGSRAPPRGALLPRIAPAGHGARPVLPVQAGGWESPPSGLRRLLMARGRPQQTEAGPGKTRMVCHFLTRAPKPPAAPLTRS